MTIDTARSISDSVEEIVKTRSGTMLWFNERKDCGVILTDEGQRLPVLGDSFAGGLRPKGRCARAPVSFGVAVVDGVRAAQDVELVVEPSPRRARRRHRGAGS